MENCEQNINMETEDKEILDTPVGTSLMPEFGVINLTEEQWRIIKYLQIEESKPKFLHAQPDTSEYIL